MSKPSAISRKPALEPCLFHTYADRIGDVVRHYEDFEFVSECGRLGGSSMSSGVFRERAMALEWLGKCEPYLQSEQNLRIDEDKTEGRACDEKITNDNWRLSIVTQASAEWLFKID